MIGNTLSQYRIDAGLRFSAAGLLALTLVACSPQKADPLPEADYHNLDVARAQAHMASGALTAVSLTQYYLDRIAALDDAGPTLNAVIETNPEALAIAAALDAEREKNGPRGPLHGIPVLLKANIDTRDSMATTAGSLALAGHLPMKDAFLVARLREAGAVILGLANLSEWANYRGSSSISGWSSLGGQNLNPYVLDRTPCGSSSGSASAVAADLALLSVGTETNGSIMCPASFNGVVGVKPTLGLVSRDGIIPIAHSQDTAGPMARTVADAAVLLQAMAVRDPADAASERFPVSIPDYVAALELPDLAGVRIGVVREYAGAGTVEAIEEAYSDAVDALRASGATIVDSVSFQVSGLRQGPVLSYEFKHGINAYLQAHGSPNGMRSLADLIAFNEAHADEVMPLFGQEIFLQAEARGSLTDPEYLEALETNTRRTRGALDSVLTAHDLDALIGPSNGPASKIVGEDDSPWVGVGWGISAISGYPDMTLPMTLVNDLPVGISILGAPWSEATLLRIANRIERARGTFPPPKFLAAADSTSNK